MSKRLILCFDGTWNTPDTDSDETDVETNVCRFHESLLDKSKDGWEQRSWYHKGVGAKWFERIRGGAFGLGLDRNIMDGYAYLITNYEENDEIYVLGFSRGAYTARSLVGLIRNSGLPRMDRMHERARNTTSKGTPEETLQNAIEKTTEEAYEIYRTRDEGPDSETARFFRQKYAREIKIWFLGVWDTVGALGIPLESFTWFNKRKYQFHDTELSRIVQHAYHAVAIDEHRKDYDVTLWRPSAQPQQQLEQRWFIGAHADVGGGYEDRRLSDITLLWMQNKAAACGLAFNLDRVSQDIRENHKAAPTDSYKQFIKGIYSRHNPRHYRDICQTEFGNEVIDESVLQRLQNGSDYRPKNKGIPR